MPDQGPEPTGWELMRGLKRVEDAIHESYGNFVSVALFSAAQVREDERHTATVDHMADVRKDVELVKRDALATERRLEEQRTRNRQFVIALIATPVVGAVIVWLLNGGIAT